MERNWNMELFIQKKFVDLRFVGKKAYVFSFVY